MPSPLFLPKLGDETGRTTGTYERVPIERGPSNAREVVVSGDLDAGQKVLLCAPEA